MQPRIRKAYLLITHVLDSCVKLLAVLHISSAQGRSVDRTSAGSSYRGLPSTACRGPKIIPSQSSHHSKILVHLHPIKILGSHMDTISVSFPVNPRPDGATPVNRHKQVAHRYHTRADRTSSGPDDLGSVRARRGVPQNSSVCCFTAPLLPCPLSSMSFSCEQILKRPLRMEFEFFFLDLRMFIKD